MLHGEAEREAKRKRQAPPAPPQIVLAPLKTTPKPLALCTQAEFNELRISVVESLQRFITQQAYASVIHVDTWLHEGRRFINFDNIPPITYFEGANEMNRYNLVGVYWLVNHHDTQGSWSRG